MQNIMGISNRHKLRADPALHFFEQLAFERHPQGGGWGIAMHEGSSLRMFSETTAAQSSILLSTVLQMRAAPDVILGGLNSPVGKHEIAQQDVQPFSRELSGRQWSFVHQGDIRDLSDVHTSRFQPVGQSSTEKLFCRLMEGIASGNDGCRQKKSLDDNAFLTLLADEVSVLNQCGEFNFILSDGERFFIHSHSRLFLHRNAHQVWAASCAASDKDWETLEPNTLLAFNRGLLTGRRTTRGMAPSEVWDRLSWDECDGRDRLTWRAQSRSPCDDAPEIDLCG